MHRKKLSSRTRLLSLYIKSSIKIQPVWCSVRRTEGRQRPSLVWRCSWPLGTLALCVMYVCRIEMFLQCAYITFLSMCVLYNTYNHTHSLRGDLLRWCTPWTAASGNRHWDLSQFQASLIYIMDSGSARATQRQSVKTNKQINKHEKSLFKWYINSNVDNVSFVSIFHTIVNFRHSLTTQVYMGTAEWQFPSAEALPRELAPGPFCTLELIWYSAACYRWNEWGREWMSE